MKKFTYVLTLLFLVSIVSTTFAQDSLQVKTYKFKDLNVIGTSDYSKSQIIRFTGFFVGKKITIPGSDIGNAIKKLWNTNLFSDVEFYVAEIIGEDIVLTVNLQPLPNLGEFNVIGLSKSKTETLKKDLKLSPGIKINDDLRKKIKNKLQDQFKEKGYYDASVQIKETANAKDSKLVDWEVTLTKGKKIKIDQITINGNNELSDGKLKAKLKNTKQKNILRVWKPSKFNKDKYQEDLKNVLNEYKSRGFRDANIVSEKVTRNFEGNLDVEINVDEGKRYFLGNVDFVGNSTYPTDYLKKIVGYKKGDPYDAIGINKKVSGSDKDDDIYTLYTDNGYLFANVNTIEKSVVNDTINLEIRISEGEKATWGRVTFSGNDTTHDHVIQRMLGTKAGELFSKSDIKNTLYQLAGLGYFEAQEIKPDFQTHPETKTADIHWYLAEKGSSQVELQGGYGGGRFIGTLGLTFNNFSLRNLLSGNWKGFIPQGDGQQISLRAQAGNNYQNYSISFVEPWISGKRPTSLSTSFYYSQYDYLQSNLKIIGATVGLTKRLMKPDNYFTFANGLSYQVYDFKDYPFTVGTLSVQNGKANNFNYYVTLARNSAGPDPIFPQNGSEFELTAKLTPPYSLFNNKDYSTLSVTDKIEWLEYYKIKMRAYWYQELAGKLVLKLGGEFGFLGQYNSNVGLSPFERFYVGGTGLTGNRFDGREIVPLRGYRDASSYGGTANDITPLGGGSVYNKFLMELRYPISMNQTAKIYGLSFLEAGNTWSDTKEFKPFELRRSAGVGIRIFMQAFGLLGFDFGYGFDNNINQIKPSGWQTHFIIGRDF